MKLWRGTFDSVDIFLITVGVNDMYYCKQNSCVCVSHSYDKVCGGSQDGFVHAKKKKKNQDKLKLEFVQNIYIFNEMFPNEKNFLLSLYTG